MTHPDTYVKRTHIGVGLFAARDFKRGEILWLIDDFDIKIPLHTYKNVNPIQRKKLDTYTYIDFNYRVIVPWDDGKYINHSCSPNASGLLQFDNLTVALRDIKKDEEIVENYNSYFGHFETFKCECGADNCAGKISSEQAYRPELRLDINEIGEYMTSFDQYLLKVKTKETEALFELLSIFQDI